MATSANTTANMNMVAAANTAASVKTTHCSPNALGISVGALWALYIFSGAIMAMFGWGMAFVKVFSSLYLGYAASFGGAVIGAIWAFVDGYVAGFVVGWLYNRLAK